MKKIASKEFIIGLSVIVAIIILIFGIDYLKGVNLFKPANFYIAEYDNVAGLEMSAPVTIDGYKVGQVRDIIFDYQKPGKIQVLLALDKKLRLPEDSYAEITSSLLAGAAVSIHLGNSNNTIPVGEKIASKEQSDMMASLNDELMPAVKNVLSRVDTLVANLNVLVADPAMLQSIQRLDGITDNLLATTSGLRTTVGKDVPVIMRNAGNITHNIDTLCANLGQLSYQLKSLPIGATMTNVETLTANLEKFSRQLNNPNSSLSLLTSDPQLYNRLNTVAADVDSLIVDIKKNPKRYISIKLL